MKVYAIDGLIDIKDDIFTIAGSFVLYSASHAARSLTVCVISGWFAGLKVSLSMFVMLDVAWTEQKSRFPMNTDLRSADTLSCTIFRIRFTISSAANMPSYVVVL